MGLYQGPAGYHSFYTNCSRLCENGRRSKCRWSKPKRRQPFTGGKFTYGGRKVDNICIIKGVAILTVACIIAETNGFILFKNIKQLVSYSGYDVFENQSGKHVGKTRISKKGNGHIRRALHMPAFNVVRFKVAPFIKLYERTLKKHNIKMKSYVAIQKKLLIMIYTLWTRGAAFDCNYQQISTGKMETETSSQFSFAEAVLIKNKQKNSADQKPALQKVINRQTIAV